MPGDEGLHHAAQNNQHFRRHDVLLEVSDGHAFVKVLVVCQPDVECIGASQERHQRSLLQLVGQDWGVTKNYFVFEEIHMVRRGNRRRKKGEATVPLS